MTRFLMAVIAALAPILPTAALAQSITPDGPFQADGNTNLIKGGISLPCTTHFAGTVSGGVASITSASFSGSGGFCNTYVAKNLPWTITATSATTITISGYALDTPFGNCLPGSINANYNNATHVFQYSGQSLPGGCIVAGTLATHDSALTLVN